MKKESFYEATTIRSEIDCLNSQIEEIEKPRCEDPMKLGFVHDDKFRQDLQNIVISSIRKRIKQLEIKFDNLK